MTNQERAIDGVSAMIVGATDYEQHDLQTNAIDTIANVLHAVSAGGQDVASILERALVHFEAQLNAE